MALICFAEGDNCSGQNPLPKVFSSPTDPRPLPSHPVMFMDTQPNVSTVEVKVKLKECAQLSILSELVEPSQKAETNQKESPEAELNELPEPTLKYSPKPELKKPREPKAKQRRSREIELADICELDRLSSSEIVKIRKRGKPSIKSSPAKGVKSRKSSTTKKSPTG